MRNVGEKTSIIVLDEIEVEKPFLDGTRMLLPKDFQREIQRTPKQDRQKSPSLSRDELRKKLIDLEAFQKFETTRDEVRVKCLSLIRIYDQEDRFVMNGQCIDISLSGVALMTNVKEPPKGVLLRCEFNPPSLQFASTAVVVRHSPIKGGTFDGWTVTGLKFVDLNSLSKIKVDEYVGTAIANIGGFSVRAR